MFKGARRREPLSGTVIIMEEEEHLPVTPAVGLNEAVAARRRGCLGSAWTCLSPRAPPASPPSRSLSPPLSPVVSSVALAKQECLYLLLVYSTGELLFPSAIKNTFVFLLLFPLTEM